MNCQTCRDQLSLYVLDGLDLSDRAAVEKHLDGCPECRSEADAVASLAGGFAELAESAAGDQYERLTERVACEVRIARRRDQLRGWSRPLAKTAAIAMVGALSVLVSLHRRRLDTARPADALAWRHGGIGHVHGTAVTYPIVGGNTVLAIEGGASCRRLVALDRHTGSALWRTPFSVTGCSAVASSGRAFAWRETGIDTQSLVALDVRTGSVLWEQNAGRLPAATGGQLVTTDNAVCWVSADRVTAVDADTGELSWTRQLDKNKRFSVPATDGDTIYVASAEALYALAADTGNNLWRSTHEGAGSSFVAPLLRHDGNQIVLAHRRFATQSRLTCHDAATGRLQWERDVVVPIHSLTVAGDVYVRSTAVHAFSGATGTPVWTAPVSGCGPLAVARGRLFAVEGRDGLSVLALDPDTGRRLWSQRIASSCSGLVVAGDTGYLGARDGALYALNMETRDQT